MKAVFNYSDSCSELKLKINNRIVVMGAYNPIWDDNLVTISQTTTERIIYPSLFKYGFRIKALK